MKVEIGQYKELNKGVLKGKFSLVIYPEGQKILGCTHFANDKGSWWTMPQIEIKKEGEKTEYIPYVSYMNKEYAKELKDTVQQELNTLRGVNEQKDPVQDESPFIW